MNTRGYGRVGEESAALYLISHGYHIIEKNVYIGRDEIDIIAENDENTVFVEVKTRRQIPDSETKYGTPASAVDVTKQNNIIRAVDGYMRDNPAAKPPRIDVIEVFADPASDIYRVLLIRHHENAVTRRGKFSRAPRRK